ncbi:DUF6234 family protein [Streptomyces sp. NBC_00385]|uniref:DUF6234 family protein n=1 Tax=Streptomyces sp. NBC_00385 TaxID=2975733 RepID=UPI002DDA17C4|nr:DUF6234 family protein [Streptomyces sp. NBC_00385]WRZ03051.1 DUF6234 family protein [Streptomyces sp. NBC_00385]
MTHELRARLARRSWPWSNTTSRGSDIATAVMLLIVEVLVFGWTMFGYGMDGWAAQGNREETDEADLASIAFMQHFLIAVLVLFALATLARAPWAAVLQLLTAGAVAMMLVLSQHAYEQSHPGPAPTPSAGYSPCYSGSGRCN